MKVIFLLILVASVMLGGCDASNSFKEFRSNNVLLHLPSEYILPNFPGSVVALDVGDSSRGISMKIPISDLDLGYVDQKKEDFFIVSLYVDEQLSIEKYVPNNVVNAWLGEEKYQDRIIEYDDRVSLYRVYLKAAYPKYWHYFNEEPRRATGITDIDLQWVSDCIVSPVEEESKNLSNVRYKAYFMYADILISWSFSGNHIKNISSSKELLLKKIDQWQSKEVE